MFEDDGPQTRGFVKLWRMAADHPILNSAERLGAWAWILCKTQHHDYEWLPHDSSRPIVIPAGCVLLSVRTCERRWNMKRHRVEGFIAALKATKRPMIQTVRRTPWGTIYRVVRYDFWSGEESRIQTPQRRTPDTSQTDARQIPDTSQPRIRRVEGTSSSARARDGQLCREAEALREYLGEYGDVVDQLTGVIGHDAWAVDLWFRMRPQAQELPQCPLGKLKPAEARPLVLAGALYAYAAVLSGLESPTFGSRHALGFVRREVEGYLSDADYDPRDRPRVGEIDLEAWASKGD